MKKALLIILIVIVVLLALGYVFLTRGPNLKQYQHLINPAMSQKADQNMLEVMVTGKPDLVSGNAIKLLYKAYYGLKGVPKSFRMAAPRSRWLIVESIPQEQWVGLFGLPIPENITALPKLENADSLQISIVKWQYGTVAEILHVGPYDQEQPTVQRLHDYIAQQGYVIAGEHEEEYVKGPGLLGKGNPDKYLTIIRYKVEKVQP
jgi:hypothetical protein